MCIISRTFLIRVYVCVCRYKMLVEELKKQLIPSHPDQTNLDSALALIGSVAIHINESVRQHEVPLSLSLSLYLRVRVCIGVCNTIPKTFDQLERYMVYII